MLTDCEKFSVIHFNTNNPDWRIDWLKARHNGIGASDAASVLGKSKWKSNCQLFAEKVQPFNANYAGAENKAMKFGNEAEPLIRAMFAAEHPEFKVEDGTGHLLINKINPFMYATLDGVLTDCDGNRSVLEIKTATTYGGVWEPPEQYVTQVLHQMAVTGFDRAIIRAHVVNSSESLDGNVATDYEFQYVASEWEREIHEIIKAEFVFWDCVKKGTPPALIIKDI